MTCTYTNIPNPPKLTVNQVLKPSDDPGKFNLQIDDQTDAPDVGDGGTTGQVVVRVRPGLRYCVGVGA